LYRVCSARYTGGDGAARHPYHRQKPGFVSKILGIGKATRNEAENGSKTAFLLVFLKIFSFPGRMMGSGEMLYIFH
jgi:hypothetical protein